MNQGLILPKEGEIRNLAYQLYEARGRRHGHDVSDWVHAEKAARFHKNFERVAHYLFDAKPAQWLSERKEPSCRFCGKNSSQVTFKEDTHAVPAFLGNNSVFTYSECDVCNQFFGGDIEDHFAKMLAGVRTMLKMRGRKKIPSHKAKDGSRIDFDAGVIKVHTFEGALTRYEASDDSVSITTETQPFVPLAVFKCLARIGLAVLPEVELSKFQATLNWIREPDHTKRASDFRNAGAILSLTPGLFPDRYGWVDVFRRRDPRLWLPSFVVVLVSQNITLQTYIPLCSGDEHLAEKAVTIPAFPAGINCAPEFGPTTFENLPLGGSERISPEVTVGSKFLSSLDGEGANA